MATNSKRSLFSRIWYGRYPPPKGQGPQHDAAMARYREESKARAQAHVRPPTPRTSAGRNPKISEVGTHPVGGGLACPKCRGAAFKAHRSASAKVVGIPLVGIGTFLAPKTKVTCTTCGSTYRRG